MITPPNGINGHAKAVTAIIPTNNKLGLPLLENVMHPRNTINTINDIIK